MNQSFGTFTHGLPNPVQVTDLQELDIFHNDNDPKNKLTTQIFSSERYKRMHVRSYENNIEWTNSGKY